MQAKLFLTDDPALVVLYSQLRQKTLQTLRGASKVTPKVEWAFVLHNARLYDRMGCDLLALDLGLFFSLGAVSKTNRSQFVIGSSFSPPQRFSRAWKVRIHDQFFGDEAHSSWPICLSRDCQWMEDTGHLPAYSRSPSQALC
jgi:hypothetical protein